MQNADDPLADAKGEPAALELMKVPARNVLLEIDTDLAEAFDVVFDDGTRDAVRSFRGSKLNSAQITTHQGFGLEAIEANTLSVLMNVTAAIVVLRLEYHCPALWRWLTGQATPPKEGIDPDKFIDLLMTSSGLPDSDKEKLSNAIHENPGMMAAIKGLKSS